MGEIMSPAVIAVAREKNFFEGPLKVTNLSRANYLASSVNISIVYANVENVNYYNKQCQFLVQTDKILQWIFSECNDFIQLSNEKKYFCSRLEIGLDGFLFYMVTK